MIAPLSRPHFLSVYVIGYHVHLPRPHLYKCGRGSLLGRGYHFHTYPGVDVVASLEAPNLVPPKRLPRPFLSKCGRDRSYLSRPQTCGREKHTFLRRGIPRPPISGREKPNIVVVKDLISSSGPV